MKIKINKIFGKYDTEIDLDKRCTIFIGENGIGKSTSLKIIDSILRMDYDGLIKYYFEGFEVNNIKVSYEDLIPSQFDMISHFATLDYQHNDEDVFDENGNTKEKYLDIYGVSDHEIMEQLFYRLTQDEYERLIRSSVNNMCSMRFKGKLISIFNDIGAWLFAENLDLFFHRVDEILNDLLLLKQTPLYQSEKYMKLVIKDYIKTFPINMVRDYNILISEDKYIYNTFDTKIKDDYIASTKKKNNLDRKYIHPNINDYKEYYKKVGKEEYIKNNIESFNNVSWYDFVSDIKDNSIDLSKLLFNVGYSSAKDDIAKVIEKYYDFILNNDYNSVSYDSNEIRRDISYMKKLKYTIIPVMPKDSFFDFNYDLDSAYSKLFFKFAGEYPDCIYNLESNIKNNNKKIKNLQSLFDKYFYNKKVEVTPSKIILSTKKDDYDDIDYDFLSEGEKKLIILFTICTLVDDVVLLLDEPETSLSIVWQETLIPDLLKYSNVKNIIVATQSPYISSDDSLTDSIYPIIDKEGEVNG